MARCVTHEESIRGERAFSCSCPAGHDGKNAQFPCRASSGEEPSAGPVRPSQRFLHSLEIALEDFMETR